MGRQIVGCLVQSQGGGGVVERVRGVRLFISKISIRKLRLPFFFFFLFFFLAVPLACGSFWARD